MIRNLRLVGECPLYTINIHPAEKGLGLFRRSRHDLLCANSLSTFLARQSEEVYIPMCVYSKISYSSWTTRIKRLVPEDTRVCTPHPERGTHGCRWMC